MTIFTDPWRARRVGFVLATASIVVALGGVALFLAAGGRFANSWMPHNVAGTLTLAVAFALMVRNQPNNAAVWTLGWSMVLQAFGQVLLIGLLTYGVTSHLGAEFVRGGLSYTYTHGELPRWLSWLHVADAVTWIPAVIPLVTFALLLFPDGRLPSRRWRPVVWLTVAGILLTSLTFGLLARPRPEAIVYDLDAGPLLGALAATAGIATASAIVLSVASLIVRYRRSSGIERRQIRWIATGGSAFGLSTFVWGLAAVDPALVERVFWVASLVTFPVLLGSYAVAILRYRLYDIDVVISRSVVVATLAGFIALVYIAVVVGVGQLVGAGDEPRLGLQIVATAIIAVAFQPLRARARRFADRLVLGRRASPYEVLAGFSRQAAQADDETALQRVADLLAGGTGSAPAVVWLRVGDQLRPAAVSEGSESPAPQPLDNGELPGLDASLAVPVRHDDELLGAITLVKPRSDPPTEQDAELTSRLAAGLALLLRNARLTVELRERLRDIEASRQRIVHAQDDARRGLERDLRSGVQTLLAELTGLLEQARDEAEEAGAATTTSLLAQLHDEADDAIATLRDLAQGIYPPQLEADGLGPALTEHARRLPLPVTVHAAGLGRHGRDIEGAVYFCVLEALQNAARYAEATSVHVRLDTDGDALRFEVSDDGVGFDAASTTHGSGIRGMADRLDTIGGSVTVTSSPGVGTRVIGHVPISSPSRSAEVLTATSAVPEA